MKVLKLKKIVTICILLMLLTGLAMGTFGCGGGEGSGDTNGAANGGGEAEEGSGKSQGTQIIPFTHLLPWNDVYCRRRYSGYYYQECAGFSMNAEARAAAFLQLRLLTSRLRRGKAL